MNLSNISHVASAFAAAGRRGSGKTSRMVRHVLKDRAFDFVFAFDPTGQLSQKFNVAPTTRADRILEAITTGIVCYMPPASDDEGRADFDWFSGVAFAASEHLDGSKVFVADEIQTWVSAHSLPAQFYRLVDKGRWYALDLAFTCQTLNTVHNSLRNQLTEVAAFAHTSARAMSFLIDDLGFPAVELKALKRGEYLTCKLDPVGPIYAGDDHRGVLKMLPNQTPPVSDFLIKFRGKSGRKP